MKVEKNCFSTEFKGLAMIRAINFAFFEGRDLEMKVVVPPPPAHLENTSVLKSCKGGQGPWCH
jgi:hypothetical protein